MKLIQKLFYSDFGLVRLLFAILIFQAIAIVSMSNPLAAQQEVPARHQDPPRQGMPSRHDTDIQRQDADIQPQDADIQRIKSVTTKGGWIRLIIVGEQAKYWTEVEWLGGSGNWHVVDGWRGDSYNSTVSWFVKQSDLAKGPFRWNVYTEENGELLTSSGGFYLPAERKVITVMQIDVGQVK